MSTCSQLLAALKDGAHNQALAALYALDGGTQRLDAARARALPTTEADHPP